MGERPTLEEAALMIDLSVDDVVDHVRRLLLEHPRSATMAALSRRLVRHDPPTLAATLAAALIRIAEERASHHG